MPIDFDEIVAGFEVPLRSQTKTIAELFAALAKTFGTWAKQIEEADRATAGIPIIDMKFGAVSLHAVGALGTPQGLAGDIQRAGGALADGLSFIPTAVTQELLLFNLVAVGRKISQRLEQRTNQMLALDPGMFEGSESSFFDIPALGTMAVAMLSEADLFRPSPADGLLADDAEPTTSAQSASPVDRLDEYVNDYADYVLATFVALPAITTVLDAHITALSASFRITILQQLHAVEVGLLHRRSEVIEALRTYADYGAIAKQWLDPLGFFLITDVARIATWLPKTTDFYLGILVKVVAVLDMVGHVLFPILRFVGMVFDFFLDFDLLFFIPGVSLTIGDVVAFGARSRAIAIGSMLQELSAQISIAAMVGPRALRSALAREVRIYFQLGRMFLILGGQPAGNLWSPPPLQIDPIPDFGRMVLTPQLSRAVADYVQSLGPRVSFTLRSSVGAAGRTMLDMSRLAQQLSNRTQHGVVGLQGDARGAVARAPELMADEVQRVHDEVLTGRATDDAVLQFVVVGARTVGALTPLYIDSFQRMLSRRRFDLREPSPHILAKRARLVGVHSPRMVVPLGQRDLGPDTTEITANAVRDGFGNIYSDGLTELRLNQTAARVGAR